MTGTRRSTDQQPRRGCIGLSFSGGGFRATAFSLGTLTLLQDLGLLAKAKVMSSVSGGSLALATYLCAKAGSDATTEADFRFDERFYQPLMDFLEGEQLAEVFLNLGALLRGEKLILKAADATNSFLNECLQGEGDRQEEKALLGNEKITEMLANDSLSPDFIFFNASNITSLDLFRFGIERGQKELDGEPVLRPIFVLNRYFLKHTRDSATGKNLYHYAQGIRLADCVASSFAFPIGFEPLLFPDDFFRPDEASVADADRVNTSKKTDDLEETKKHFRDDLICDYKPYLALLDGGLYDNLGLASVEDIRRFLSKSNGVNRSQEKAIHYVIATDVDQIPTQISAYSDAEKDRLLNKNAYEGESRQPKSAPGRLLSWLFNTLRRNPIRNPILLALPMVFLAIVLHKLPVNVFLSPLFWGLPLILVLLLLAITVSVLVGICGLWLLSRFGLGEKLTSPRNLLGLSETFQAEGSLLQSWWQVIWGALQQLQSNPQALAQALVIRRVGQLLPAFSGYLKRTRSLTYGYLEKAYAGHGDATDCHLIRNMIFELMPGKEPNPDYVANLITLPISDYRHEEGVDPVSPIARKIVRARTVSTLLQSLQVHRQSQTSCSEAGLLESAEVPLMLRLLHTAKGQLLPEACQIIDELNLEQADHIWRWLCNNLSCYDDPSDSGCLPAHPHNLSIPIGSVVAKIRKVFKEQIGEDEQLLERCLISLDESTSSYSWIPLICEMATNVPTTLWLKGSCWYVPNDYDHHRRISTKGRWSTSEPKENRGLQAIHLRALGPAPAAAVCTVAGYVSTGFNLLEFFYTWTGNCACVRENLYERICREPFLFASSESLQELEALPYKLRHHVWQRLKQAQSTGSLPPALLGHLALLEGPLNRRAGLPESFWGGGPRD